MIKIYSVNAPCDDDECHEYTEGCISAGSCPKYQKWLLNLKRYNSNHHIGYSNQNGYEIPTGQAK